MALDKIWDIKPPSAETNRLAEKTGISTLQAQLFLNRGISSSEAVRLFLSPKLGRITDPMLLPDMEEAISLIVSSIERQDFITIYGDYDADGLTASALVSNFLNECGIPSYIFVPHRLKHGYGLNAPAIKSIARARRGLLITVDCGISDTQLVEMAKSEGMDVVVTDHHKVPGNFERICPTVNPQRPESLFPDKDLSGVGVAFMLVLALRMALRKKGWFKSRPEPDLKEYLDLVAIGTIADQVPLIAHNRIFVQHGIRIIKNSRWAGIRALLDAASLAGKALTCEDIAFRVAPRLNAPGRVDSADPSVEILTTSDYHVAKKMAFLINRQNSRRQSLEQDILKEIYKRFPLEEMLKKKLIITGEKSWHQGVLGIVASRLVDLLHRPCMVYSIKNGLAIGSGRSIDAFNIHTALTQVSPFLEKFGGHAHAAGFTLKVENMKDFERNLELLADEWLSIQDLKPCLEIDAELSIDNVDTSTIKEIQVLAPFGKGNPEPLFCAKGVRVLDARIVGDRHLKMRLGGRRKIFEAIGFGMFQRKSPQIGDIIDIAFTPEINSWQGREILQLKVIDFRISTNNP